MTDNELIQLFVPIIEAGLTANGYTGVTVFQTDQPTQQGIPDGPTVFFTHLHDHPYGFVSNEQYVDDMNRKISRSSQPWETTFQVDVRYAQDPADITLPTASDVCGFVALLLNAQPAIETLSAAKVGILRVSEVRNPYFTDDRDQQEAFPSFDFTLTHCKTIASEVPVIESIQPGIYPI